MTWNRCLCFPFLAVGLACQAKVVYVNKAAAGPTHTGASWSAAALTVADGLAAAVDGDEIWVAKGGYSETVTVAKSVALYGGFTGTETSRSQRDWRANVTTLSGAGGDETEVTCQAPSTSIDGFTITQGGHGVGLFGLATLRHNTITANVQQGVYVTSHATAKLTDNTISANGGAGVYDYGIATLVGNVISGNDAGVVVSGNLSAWGNTISGSVRNGVEVYGRATIFSNVLTGNGRGVFVYSGTGVVTNNTLDANNVGIYVATGTAICGNNVIAYSQDHGVIVEETGSIPTFTRNDLFSNAAGPYSGYTPPVDQTNLAVDPKFANRAGGNYRLAAGSPLLDAGDDSVTTPDQMDADGKRRVLGTHADVGAYEAGVSAAIPAATLQDVVDALRAHAGLRAVSAQEMARLNVDTLNAKVNMVDALYLARRVAGLDVRP